MTDGVPNIVGPIGGLVGIGITATAANSILKTVEQQSRGKKIKAKRNLNPGYAPNPYGKASFASTMDDRIRRMI